MFVLWLSPSRYSRLIRRILQVLNKRTNPFLPKSNAGICYTSPSSVRLIVSCFVHEHSPRVIGGGPTGVEFAAELHDLLHTDIAKHYPNLGRLAKITLYDVAPNILGTFDSGLAEYVCPHGLFRFFADDCCPKVCGEEVQEGWHHAHDKSSCRTCRVCECSCFMDVSCF